MSITNHKKFMKGTGRLKGVGFAAVISLLLSPVFAQEIIKTNNTDYLNLGSSWVGGVAPGEANVAVWNSTVTSANTSEISDNWDVGGVKVTNPGGAVGIGAVTLNSGLVTANGTNDTFTYTGTDVINGGVVSFTNAAGGSIPTGLFAQQIYFIVNVDTVNKTFQISDTEAGAAINFTSNGGNLYQNARPTVTLGSSGINLSSASQSLALFSAPVILSASQTWTVASGRTLDSNNNGNFSGLAVMNSGHALKFDGAGTIDIGQIHGSGGILKDGTGRVNLHAGNYTFTGDVVLNAGTLNAGSTLGALGSGASTLALNGGTLTFLANGARNYARNTTIGGDVAIYNNNSGGNGAQTYTFGTLAIGTNILTVNRNPAGVTNNVGSIVFGPVSLTGDATFNVGPHGTNSQAFNELILGATGESGGSHSLTKTGDGTLILNSNNTYTGETVIQAGVLKLSTNGNLSGTSAITMHAGATLDVSSVAGGFSLASGQVLAGEGTVAGALVADGSVSPGIDGIGKLNAADVTWNDTSAWLFELGAVPASDRLTCTGSFLRGSGTDFVFDLQSTGAEGVYTLVTWSVSTDFDVDDFTTENVPVGLTPSYTLAANELILSLSSTEGGTNEIKLNQFVVNAGVPQIQWTANPGSTSVVEVATTLGPSPAADWTNLSVVVVGETGLASFSETNAPAIRFYRVADQAP